MPYETTIRYVNGDPADTMYSLDKPQWIDGKPVAQQVITEFLYFNPMFVLSVFTMEISHEKLGEVVKDI